MTHPSTITLIGNGRMAFAIAEGLKQTHTIEVVGRDLARLQAFSSRLGGCQISLLSELKSLEGKQLLLCVKPHALPEIASLPFSGEAQSLISVLAGVSIKTLKAAIPAVATLRAMPNIAALKKKSATTLTGDASLKEMGLSLFRAIGSAIWVESEKQLDIATALAGSGPAYLALVAESLIDGAVREGLGREQATELAQGLFEGFAALLAHKHPAQIKEEVMSPGGTTAAGIAALEESAARATFMQAIHRAFEKAVSLS